MNESKNILKQEGIPTKVLDVLSDPILKFENNYEINYVNANFCNLIGFEKSKIVGNSLFDLISENDHFVSKINLEKELNSNKESKIKINLKHKKGYLIPVVFYIQSIKTKDNSSLFALVKHSRDKRGQNIFYNKLINSFPLPVILLNEEFKIVNCNNEFLSLIHYEEKDLIGKDLFSPEINLFAEKIKIINRYKELLNNRKIMPISTKIKPKKYPSLWVKIESSLITLKNETYIQSVLQRLDKQKKLKKKIEEAMKFKNELLSRTSHELKTPLISIMGFSNLLLELYSQEFKKDVISIIQEINRGSKKLEKIINTLLETTYLSSDKIKFSPSKEDLTFLIRYTVNDFKGLYMARGIRVKLDLHEKMQVNLEKEKIYEVISNIFINAIKFSPPNTEIEVSSKITEDFYIISIKDQGIGLTEKEKSQIFKPFGKIERYGQGWDLQVGGTGMGLYISKKIINLHNGEIWVESKGRGKGSVFYFSLPIRE